MKNVIHIYGAAGSGTSKAKHDQWQKLLLCKQIVLNGADDLEDNFKKVQAEL